MPSTYVKRDDRADIKRWPQLLIAVSLASASLVHAVEDRLETARTFAPMVWLGPSEIAYPMLPHAFAFDGIDNDDDGCTDLEDADEIGALVAPSNDEARREKAEKLMRRLRRLRRDLAAGVDPTADERRGISSRWLCTTTPSAPV